MKSQLEMIVDNADLMPNVWGYVEIWLEIFCWDNGWVKYFFTSCHN